MPGDSIVSVGMNKEETNVICKWQGNMKLALLGSNLFHLKSKLEKCSLTIPTVSGKKKEKLRGKTAPLEEIQG